MCPLTGKGRPTVPSIKWAHSQCVLRTWGRRSRPGRGGRLQALGGEAGFRSPHLQFCRPGPSSHRQGLAGKSHEAWRATLIYQVCMLLAGGQHRTQGRPQAPASTSCRPPVSFSVPASLLGSLVLASNRNELPGGPSC